MININALLASNNRCAAPDEPVSPKEQGVQAVCFVLGEEEIVFNKQLLVEYSPYIR